MARGDQLGRQWKIIQTLLASHCGKSAAELADEIQCHPRTVYRDLEALQIAGFPVYNERVDGRSLWALLDTVKKDIPIPLTLTELMALYFSHDMIKVLHNTVFSDALESLFNKIKATLPPESTTFLYNIQQTIAVAPGHYKDYGQYKDVISSVNDAAIRKKSLEIVYFTMHSKKQTPRTIDPYKLWYCNGGLYLIGYCHLRKGIRTFALERIKNVQVMEEDFSIPEGFDLENLMSTSFGVFQGQPQKVRVKFNTEAAYYIQETVWHESQKIFCQADESVVFEADVAVTEDLKSWILNWGSKAEVLAPQSLRGEIEAEAREMLEKYGA